MGTPLADDVLATMAPQGGGRLVSSLVAALAVMALTGVAIAVARFARLFMVRRRDGSLDDDVAVGEVDAISDAA